ncbi:hypothetical protein U1Q18_032242 [Sarracenia purpurea var. burkii]
MWRSFIAHGLEGMAMYPCSDGQRVLHWEVFFALLSAFNAIPNDGSSPTDLRHDSSPERAAVNLLSL